MLLCLYGVCGKQESRLEGREEMGDSFKDLVVWQRAIEMSLAIYKLTSNFPASEQFGLTSQLRRASVSVPSNIAEGDGKSSKGEYLSFLGHARGSNGEVQTQLIIARGLGFGSPESLLQAESLSNEVGRMLVVMMSKLKR
jgi:four helix bundle protein